MPAVRRLFRIAEDERHGGNRNKNPNANPQEFWSE